MSVLFVHAACQRTMLVCLGTRRELCWVADRSDFSRMFVCERVYELSVIRLFGMSGVCEHKRDKRGCVRTVSSMHVCIWLYI